MRRCPTLQADYKLRSQGQVGIEVRIVVVGRFPPFLEDSELTPVAVDILWGNIVSPRLGFMMHQNSMRDIDVAPSCCLQLKAEVNIVERDGQLLFVESIHSYEFLFVDDQTAAVTALTNWLTCGCRK